MKLPLGNLARSSVSLAFDLGSELCRDCTYRQRTDPKYNPVTGQQGFTIAAPTNLRVTVTGGSSYESLEDAGLNHLTERHKVRVYSITADDVYSQTYAELEINNFAFSQIETVYGLQWDWDAVSGAARYLVLIDEDETGDSPANLNFADGIIVETNSLVHNLGEAWEAGLGSTLTPNSIPPTDATAQVTAMILQFSEKEIDGSKIKFGDERVLIRAVDFGTLKPDEDDEFTDNETSLKRQVIGFKLDPTATLYTFHTRRVAT